MYKMKFLFMTTLLCVATGCLQGHTNAAQVANSAYANVHPCGIILSLSGPLPTSGEPRPLSVLAQNVICGGNDDTSAWQALGAGAEVNEATVADGTGTYPGGLFLQGSQTVVAKIGGRLFPIGSLDGQGEGAPINLSGATAALSESGGLPLSLQISLNGR